MKWVGGPSGKQIDTFYVLAYPSLRTNRIILRHSVLMSPCQLSSFSVPAPISEQDSRLDQIRRAHRIEPAADPKKAAFKKRASDTGLLQACFDEL